MLLEDIEAVLDAVEDSVGVLDGFKGRGILVAPGRREAPGRIILTGSPGTGEPYKNDPGLGIGPVLLN